MSNSSQKSTTPAKWQIPTKPCGYGARPLFHQASDEVKAKFRELYPVSFNSEMSEWFGVSPDSIQTIGHSLGLRKDRSAIVRRRNVLYHISICNGFLKIRDTDPKRFDEIRQKMSASAKKNWDRARREQLYAMRPTTRLRPSPLSEAMRSQKYYMTSERNYFADPDHPNWKCYDSQTRRSAEAEANAKARGFEIVEGED